MSALIALGPALFAAGAFASIIGMVTVAIRREERNFTLTRKAPDVTTRAARHVNGVYIRAPRPAADFETAFVWPPASQLEFERVALRIKVNQVA
jgi:hypothetical protein